MDGATRETFPIIVTQTGTQDRPSTVEALAGEKLSQVQWLSGLVTCYSRDSKAEFRTGYEPRPWSDDVPSAGQAPRPVQVHPCGAWSDRPQTGGGVLPEGLEKAAGLDPPARATAEDQGAML